MTKERHQIYSYAVELLARREHSEHELMEKLLTKVCCKEKIQDVIQECQRLGLQSDERFAEGRCRLRIRQGYGPLRIHQELRHLGIDTEIIERALKRDPDFWLERVKIVWHKKYPKQLPSSFAIIRKQKHFLCYRGFTLDVIDDLFKILES